MRDIELADRLGFANVSELRKLIRRHGKYLKKISEVITVAVPPMCGPIGGDAETSYLLTEAQIVFVIVKAGTPAAMQAAAEIARAFDHIPAPIW
jgi:hypothetical protein